MRKNKIRIIVLMILLYTAMLVSADEQPQYIQEAQKLYEQNKYIESLKILESNNETDGYKYYLILLNEKEIGLKAMKDDYYKYAHTHPDRYYYWEPSGCYIIKLDRINELMELVLKNSPDDKKLISKMLYLQASGYDAQFAEVENMSEQQYDEIINKYRKALEHSDDKDKEKIEKRISHLESVKAYEISSGN